VGVRGWAFLEGPYVFLSIGRYQHKEALVTGRDFITQSNMHPKYACIECLDKYGGRGGSVAHPSRPKGVQGIRIRLTPSTQHQVAQ
jgi:hypothetical protein